LRAWSLRGQFNVSSAAGHPAVIAPLQVAPPRPLDRFIVLCYNDYQKCYRLAKSFGEASMNLKVVNLTAIALAALTAPALAHHSFAMFDAQETITFQGTVKEFEWRNPHAWLRVMVNDEKTGKAVLWALELSSPARLVTMGMRADSVKEGDAVSVTFHPMKDGTRGGQFIQAVLPGGKQVIRANARDENEQ
jgi:Family of unknown function (DUF6152)